MRTIDAVDQQALRDFASRDWSSVASTKTAHWAQMHRENPRAVWDSAQALLAHVRRLRPDFPTDEEREADLRDHLALRSRLDRAAHAFSRR